ncbi:hypothetical protein CGRA01v4_07896 [Colletotrichum graminicola]|uniref:Uncharacterized protein n=1 Tax=Colletotrichum graminicola (strain M1.001 / M2 / FGSC 10212) TaxID=645133 RepID=E3Q7P3_COLGM|nr:uncharacterized protein GLRG_02076 [Colletotrichum graminicola M1.001]EFQ26905.1 hypothetical protein GLRG_02076 [Colletotrichum graminicola M1.001]WDK16613.1 hypothetical protein CGRA01v4_07896 [Colletotrichum graminicola]
MQGGAISGCFDLLTKAEQIQLSAAKNTGDINKLLQSALEGRDYLDMVEESKKKEILADLRRQVDGSFLWATLMLEIFKEALRFADVEEMVAKGIPHDFETYLERLVRRFPPTQHKFISDSLSCIVYAKRPLSLDELCEAIEIHESSPGDNIHPTCLLMRDRLIDACGPLVRVEEPKEAMGRQICTLSHGAVRTFLVEHPHAVSGKDDFCISPEVLGTGCLKYLQQKRYKDLLERGNMTFETSCGSDIKEHALLNYAAKYWHRHLDDVPYTSDLCDTVAQFVQSSNFMTCLQVQSLFVGGHFNFWYYSNDVLQRRSLVRAFPKWFVKKHHCGARLQKEYHQAIGEWNHFLATQSTYAGKLRGEIKRCLWGCLGQSNFLHKVPSTTKSFILEDVGVEPPARTVMFYDRVSPGGSEIDFFKLTVNETESHLAVERWALSRGRSPKLKVTQQITLPPGCLRLYQHELKKGVAEKAPLLEVTSDGNVLRVGSQLYSGNPGTKPAAKTLYEPLLPPDGPQSYIQAISCNSRYFAVARRDRISENDVKIQVDPADAADGDRNSSTDTLLNSSSSSSSHSSQSSTGSSSYDGSTDSDSDSEDATPAVETSKEDKPDVSASGKQTANSVADSLEVKSEFSDRCGYNVLDWTETSSFASNSARESWSEGSTSARSDEIGEDRILGDFDTESSLQVKEDGLPASDLGGSSDSGRGVHFENTPSQASSLSSAKTLDMFVDRSSDEHSSSESEDEAPSSIDDSVYDYSSSNQSDDDNEETQAAIAKLEGLLESRRKKQEGTLCEVQVYHLEKEDGRQQTKVFSFRQRSRTRLYASPPAFHPTSDLLVWPLGDNEILFANFTENAYFIRTGTKSQPQSCQVSVQCHFSECGMYLHMASFEGIKMRYTDGEVRLGFKILVTTHRLSRRKTARSPPHLIYRTSVNLVSDLAEGEKLDVMNLPFSLSWAKDHLFVTEKSLRLLVHRLPLFRDVEKKDVTQFAPRGVLYNLGDIFLPTSSLTRKIHFFASEDLPKPEDSAQSKIKSSRKKKSAERSRDKYVAHVLLGSLNETSGPQSAEGASNDFSYARTAPQGFHLTQEQLGDWDGEQSHVLKQRSQTWRGGELMAKLEKFDMSEDCDIVPYLHY